MRLKEHIALTPPIEGEKNLSPELKEEFEKLLERALGVYYVFKHNNSFKEFKKNWSNGNDINMRNLLDSRQIWLECKKAEIQFEKFLQQEILSELEREHGNVYGLIQIYVGLGGKKSVAFLGSILSHPRILKNPDLSSFNNIIAYIGSTENPRFNEPLEHCFLELEKAFSSGYTLPLPSNYHYPTLVNGLLSLNPTMDSLETIAEKSNTFKSWFELKKGKIYPWPYTKMEFEPFDEKLEEQRLKELEQELSKFSKNSKPIEPAPQEPKHEHTPDTPQLINFYKRSRPDTSRPLTQQEQFTSIASLGQIKEKNANDMLQMLAGCHPEKPVRLEVKKIESPEVLRSIAALTIARALSLAALESRFDDAIRELKETQQYFRRVYEQEKKETEMIYSEKLSLLNELEQRLAGYELRIRDIEKQLSSISLPKSADAFLLHHTTFDRVKEIPDFRTLLAEKVRYLLAKQLSQNDLDTASIFSMIEETIRQFTSGLELYAEVEKSEIPMYWESSDILNERESDHLVVFGRDGRYFFTALKAQQFGGQKKKKLAYVILGRSLLSSDKENRETVATYLKQHGVSLDFTFIDTGYAGTIPEAAITYLAQMEGIEISSADIHKRISLLASAARGSGIRELSRKKIDDQSRSEIVRQIEHRAKAFYKPTSLTLEKNGRIVSQKNPKDPQEQLRAWIVEHVSLRNFAPRQDPDKTVFYLRSDPLKGYRFVADLRAKGIGTHPIELWEEKYGLKKILLKGGPSHTVRADFVGQRFLKLFFNRFHENNYYGKGTSPTIPDTDIIFQNDSPKLKIAFLDGWHDDGIELPVEHKDSMSIQPALLVDALIGNYDRTPWNFLFKDNSIAFIDNGASLTSRARGGHKGFHPSFGIEDLKTILENPQFPGKPVNEAYDNFIKVIDGKIMIEDTTLLIKTLRVFIDIMTDIYIDDIIDQAGFLNGKKSIAELKKRIQTLEKNLHYTQEGSKEYNMTMGAMETYTAAIESGGEAPYMKMALKKRRDAIVQLFTKTLEELSL